MARDTASRTHESLEAGLYSNSHDAKSELEQTLQSRGVGGQKVQRRRKLATICLACIFVAYCLVRIIIPALVETASRYSRSCLSQQERRIDDLSIQIDELHANILAGTPREVAWTNEDTFEDPDIDDLVIVHRRQDESPSTPSTVSGGDTVTTIATTWVTVSTTEIISTTENETTDVTTLSETSSIDSSTVISDPVSTTIITATTTTSEPDPTTSSISSTSEPEATSSGTSTLLETTLSSSAPATTSSPSTSLPGTSHSSSTLVSSSSPGSTEAEDTTITTTLPETTAEPSTTAEEELTSSLVHETIVKTLEDGATTVITTTSWVNVRPSSETSAAQPTDSDLQNTASRQSGAIIFMVATVLSVGLMLAW